MVASRDHLEELLGRIESMGLNEIFLVGGDVTSPAGPFDSAVGLLEALREVSHSLTSHRRHFLSRRVTRSITDAVLHEAHCM